MLSISTIPNDAALINLVGYLLQRTPPKVKEAVALMRMVRADRISWEFRLRIANAFLIQKQFKPAGALVAGLDVSRVMAQITNASQVNLLMSILIPCGRSKDAVLLVNSPRVFEHFSRYEVMDIKLRAANLLLAQKESEAAETVLTDFDFLKFIKAVNTPGPARLLFYVFNFLNKSDEIVAFLGNIKIIRLLGKENVNRLKLDLVIKITMQGELDKARRILSTVDTELLLNSTSAGLLAHAYTLFGFFDNAGKAFDTAETKALLCADFHTFKAIWHRCRWEIDLAQKNIRLQLEKRATVRALFWNALLLKACAQNTASMEKFNEILNVPIDAGMKSAVLTEIGNLFRSDLRYDEAIHYYNLAKQNNIEATHWRPYFEHALLLLYLRQDAEARQTADQGIAGHTVFEKACLALRLIVRLRSDKGPAEKDELADLESAHNALCVHPYFAYGAYISYAQALVLHENGCHREALGILEVGICEKNFVDPQTTMELRRIFQIRQPVKFDTLHSLISRGLWPFHKSNSFERNILRKLSH